MQTAHMSFTAMNGAPPMTTLSPLSTAHIFSQTIRPHIPEQVYEIPNSPVSDKCSLGEEAVTYTTQYYRTLQPQSRGTSPIMLHEEGSPKIDAAGNISPYSNSSKGSTSDSESSSANVGDIECMTVEQGSVECFSSLSDSGTGSMVGGDGTVKHWTYEDQFKQLYNLSPEKERRDFLDELFTYMQNKGTPITRIPIMAKQPLDLYKLFQLVVERGGLVEVIKKKAWRNVAKELNLPASITSAAFTMRSQYVKYLYPYECEVAKLSKPQELQVAIESNKRDRRHSETIEFLSPQLTCRTDLEQAMSPAHRGVSNAQGIQLITSPTVAIPHGSLPPYSGGFIVTGSGGQPGTHQVVQMAHHIPGIPIMVPATSVASGHVQSGGVIWGGPVSTEDKESSQEDRDEPSPPAAKKLALDISQGKVTNSRPNTSMGSFIMTPGGSIMQHPSTHLIQMASSGHSQQIPIVIPTSSAGQRDVPMKQSEISENGGKRSQQLANSQHSSSASSQIPYNTSLLQMNHHPQLAGLVMPPVTSSVGSRSMTSSEQDTRHRTVQETDSNDRRMKSPDQHVDNFATTQVSKMPFANISIRSAGGKSDGNEDSSLLVSLEINNVVYQGVLFAKPRQSSNTLQVASSGDR